mgnify:CR=1 FL=1
MKITEVERTRLAQMGESVQLRSDEGGHHWLRHDPASTVSCKSCLATILDEAIMNGEGTVQESLDRILKAIGRCDQVARVKGKLYGKWTVTG